jgi:hypothetical protein
MMRSSLADMDQGVFGLSQLSADDLNRPAIQSRASHFEALGQQHVEPEFRPAFGEFHTRSVQR